MSVTRSAIIGMVVGVGMLIPTWEPRVRRLAVAFAFGGVLAVYVLIPGLVGTIRGLFIGAFEGDPSVQSRTGSYELAATFIGRSLLFGRGLGTFLPAYWIFDNQYLLLLVEGGIVGFLILVSLLVGSGLRIALRRVGPNDLVFKPMATAIGASVLTGATLTAFFDVFYFPKAAGLLFMLTGISGAYWRCALQGGMRSEHLVVTQDAKIR